jgi:hypothetical protein
LKSFIGKMPHRLEPDAGVGAEMAPDLPRSGRRAVI